MKTDLGVLNSDRLNRDGFIFTLGALEQGMFDTMLTGMPSLVNHDFHRPEGWVYPFGLYLQPGLSRLMGRFLYAEDEREWKEVRQAVQGHLLNLYGEISRPHLDHFKALLKEHTSKEGHFIYNNCVAYVKKGIAKEVFSSLFDAADKDGLIYVSALLKEFDYVGCGVFKSKKTEFVLFCHLYFRRSLSRVNKANTYFMDNFLALGSNKDITLRIALDSDMVGLGSTFTESGEFDYCYGPHFTDDISSISTGVTRHICNEEQKFFSGISVTDFWWKNDEDEKVLEVEEVRESPSLGVGAEYFGNRYVHSIYDRKSKAFRHFDGAIRAYDEEAILQRWDTDLKKAGKNSVYTKIFRIDGALSLANWKRLIIFYFNGNRLTYEYFGIKDEYEKLLPKARIITKKEEVAPYSIDDNAGIRIFVSYHDRKNFADVAEREIINIDIINSKGQETAILESDVLRWKAFLEESGGDVKLSDEFKFVKAYDRYTYFPTVLHGNKDVQQLIEGSMTAFKRLFEQYDFQKGASSLSLGWPQDDKVVIFSLYGNNSELLKWFSSHASIPVEREGFRVFIEMQKEWLDYRYYDSDLEKIAMIRPDGIQFLSRSFIDPQWVKNLKEENGVLGYSVEIPEEETELLSLVNRKELYAVPFAELKGLGINEACNSVISQSQELMGFIWTDRPSI